MVLTPRLQCSPVAQHILFKNYTYLFYTRYIVLIVHYIIGLQWLPVGRGLEDGQRAGSEGVLEATDLDNRVRLISSKGKVGELPLAPPVDFFGTLIADLRGEGEPLVSTEDAFAITRICLRARDAADTGTWVTL